MSPRPILDYSGRGDAELLALAREGHGAAFRVFMQRFNQQLFRTARSIVRDDAEAEDVVQESYLRAYAAFDGFRGEASVLTWLTRIVINEGRRRLRKLRSAAELRAMEAAQNDGRVVNFPSTAAVLDPEREAARADVRRLLERAVDDLPEPFRLVFVLREIQECSIEETAETLALKPETVKTRLHRARRLLRERLDDEVSQAVTTAFPFLGRRCERITSEVLQKLSLSPRDLDGSA